MPAVEARERLVEFVAEMAAGLPHVRQRENALIYVRGLIEHGGRKSLQPTLFRLGEDAARYESVQQFLADSPWDPALLARACAERVAPELGVSAWVVDDTGIPKDGSHSPGVKRQYSGTLGKIGNCQVTVSVHAVGERGTQPLGWALYLPRGVVRGSAAPAQGQDSRRAASLRPSQQLASRAVRAGCRVGDPARAGARRLRLRRGLRRSARGLHESGLEYVLVVSAPSRRVRTRDDLHRARAQAWTRPAAERRAPRPQASSRSGRSPSGCPPRRSRRVPCRSTPTGEIVHGRFAFVRVAVAHPITRDRRPPRWEWLIIEWPEDRDAPSDYWLANLPEDTDPERLARLARLRWTIELDYRQLKGELGLDHYEGRSYRGFHHHCALVTCAHAFLTLERTCPKASRPA